MVDDFPVQYEVLEDLLTLNLLGVVVGDSCNWELFFYHLMENLLIRSHETLVVLDLLRRQVLQHVCFGSTKDEWLNPLFE